MHGLHSRTAPFTTREALDLGRTRRQLERDVALGHVQRVFRGVYVGGSVEVDMLVRALAVQRVLPRRCFVSHESAAELWGVDCHPPDSRERDLRITVRPGHRAGDRPGVVACEAALRKADVTVLSGVRLTTRSRTAVDLARERDLVEAVVALDVALHAGAVSLADLEHQVDAAADTRGIRTAREALALADSRADSPMESRLRAILVTAGLPPPEPQYEVRAPDGRLVGRVDLAYVRERVAVEFDGRESHLEPGQFLHDRHRHHDLREIGWEVLRFTGPDVLGDRKGVPARVRRVLQARRLAA